MSAVSGASPGLSACRRLAPSGQRSRPRLATGRRPWAQGHCVRGARGRLGRRRGPASSASAAALIRAIASSVMSMRSADRKTSRRSRITTAPSSRTISDRIAPPRRRSSGVPRLAFGQRTRLGVLFGRTALDLLVEGIGQRRELLGATSCPRRSVSEISSARSSSSIRRFSFGQRFGCGGDLAAAAGRPKRGSRRTAAPASIVRTGERQLSSCRLLPAPGPAAAAGKRKRGREPARRIRTLVVIVQVEELRLVERLPVERLREVEAKGPDRRRPEDRDADRRPQLEVASIQRARGPVGVVRPQTEPASKNTPPERPYSSGSPKRKLGLEPRRRHSSCRRARRRSRAKVSRGPKPRLAKPRIVLDEV